jgi:hypothetical protein
VDGCSGDTEGGVEHFYNQHTPPRKTVADPPDATVSCITRTVLL